MKMTEALHMVKKQNKVETNPPLPSLANNTVVFLKKWGRSRRKDLVK
jgi:hypothetical protein